MPVDRRYSASMPNADESRPAPTAALKSGHLRDLDPVTVYRIAQLREAVFDLEQGVTDADLDGRELEDGTTLLWFELPADGDGAGEVVAHIRVLTEADEAMRIGRLAVRQDCRRDGYGGRIMRAALDLTEQLHPAWPVRIDAQAYLEQWYLGMGYETVGEVFLEGGIEHVPMVYRHGR